MAEQTDREQPTAWGDEINALRSDYARLQREAAMLRETSRKVEDSLLRRAETAEAALATLRAEHARLQQDYDKVLTAWAESRERHLAAEAREAALREALTGVIDIADVGACRSPVCQCGERERVQAARKLLVAPTHAASAAPPAQETQR